MAAHEKDKKCGLVMPISAIDGMPESHWEEVRSIIKEALEPTDFSVELVSDSDEIGVIQKRIVRNLYDNDIVVCDVSGKNPNVMFELGMRLAFDKPAIIIKDDHTNYSFDTSPIEHLQYPRNLNYHTIQAFKTKLRDKVIATYNASRTSEYTTFLKHFGQFVVAKLDEKAVGTDQFVLAALEELRSEVVSLNRQLRPTKAKLPQPWRDFLFEHTNPTYVLDYIARQPDPEATLNYIQDVNSPAFEKMRSEHFKLYGKPKTPKSLELLNSELSLQANELYQRM